MTPEPTPRPSLHEIAAMLFPQSRDALRRHYDPDWATEQPEGTSRWRIKATWSLSGTFDEVIDAETEDEAKEIARDWALDDATSGDFDIDFRKIEKVAE